MNYVFLGSSLIDFNKSLPYSLIKKANEKIKPMCTHLVIIFIGNSNIFSIFFIQVLNILTENLQSPALYALVV